MKAQTNRTAVTFPLAGGFRFGDWTVVPGENLIRHGSRKVRLEPKVMRLLLSLVARHNQVCTRDELLDELWPSPQTTETSLTRALSELRRALGDSRESARYIETIQRVGYKASAPLAPLAPRPSGTLTDPFGQPLDSAREVVILADYLIARRNAHDFVHAIELLSKFVERDPHHAQVFALLAYAERILPLYGEEPAGLRTAQARAHAAAALQLDGTNGLARAVLGGLAHHQWNWSEARRQFERAISSAPFDANVLHDYAELLLHLGAIDPARQFIERACRIKPVSAAERMVLAWILLHSDIDQAGRELHNARNLGADTVFVDNLECLLLRRKGWNDKAVRRWTELHVRRSDDPLWMWPRELVDAMSEAMSNDAHRNRLEMYVRERVGRGVLDPGVAMFILAFAGALDAAFDVAALAIDERRFFVVDPWLDETRAFRADPRFGQLAARLALPVMSAANTGARPATK